MMGIEGTLDFQIGLEKRIARIYREIANQFSSRDHRNTKHASLWKKLARDECNHAVLLSIEKALLQTGARVKKPVEIDCEKRKQFEHFLSECDRQISHGVSKEEAVRILMGIESRDNQFFMSLLNASDSKLLNQYTSLSKSFKAHERRVQEGLNIIREKEREDVSIGKTK